MHHFSIRTACAMAAGFFMAADVRALETESDGQVVFEAEAYSNSVARGVRTWEVRTDAAGYSGSGFMVVTNNGADPNSNINVAVTTTSPELQYGIQFATAATYYVWVRGHGANGTEDSVHVGLSGALAAAGSNLGWTMYGGWIWTNGASKSVSVATPGVHTFNLWMREDGARIDRILLTTNASFQGRIGNAWHIPDNTEPVIGLMRQPQTAIYSNTAVTIYSGNQFQGGTNGGNQLGIGSTLYFKHATGATWSATALTFQATSGNNKYYAGTIPANVFRAGDTVQYYLRIPYSEFLPTYLATSNGVSFETELETAARANPFSYTVIEPLAQGYPSPADWRSENIYFIMTDRFYDGDPENNDDDPFSGYEPANATRLHGGDLKGLEKKLDYIKALGATAVWITPIPHNTSNRAYHGYSAYNFYKLAPQLGSTNDLTNLVHEAHARGIRIILDIVVNHSGRIIDSGDAGFPAYNAGGYSLRWSDTNIVYPPPFAQLTNFHNNGDIDVYVDPNQILGELRGLDDLRTESTYVRTNMVEIYKHWIRAADFDGYRIDTVKHVELGFWQYFGGQIKSYAASLGKTNFIQFGEVFDSSDAKCGLYTGEQAGGPFAMDSVVDYPLYDKMKSVFATASGNTKQLEDRYNALAANYDPDSQNRLVTFLDNHDNERFLSSGLANNNTNRLAVALAFLYTSRGIPCLYYGTEQHFNGANDPNNREDMFDGLFETGPSLGDNFDMTKTSFRLVAQLNNFRRNYEALRTGDHINKWNNPSGPGLFSFSRRTTNSEFFVALNTSSSSQNLTNRNILYAPGAKLVNVFNTNETLTVTAGGQTPVISVPGLSYKMYIGAADWRPLDPVVTNQVPLHGASNVAVTNPVTLRFSKPMDTTSVQAAFSVTPSVSGSFAWNASRTEMTFTPSGLGFTSLATNVIRLGTNAFDSVSTNAFFAPFETFFVTSASGLTDTVPPSVSITSPVAGATLSGPLVISGTSADNAAVTEVEFRLDGGGWMTAAGTSSWSFAIDTANLLNGPHVLYARATDSSSLVSSNASVAVRFFSIPTGYVQRIVPGSPGDVTNCDAAVWAADRAYAFGCYGYEGGMAGFSGSTISGVCVAGQALYRYERYSQPSNSTFSYRFDCPEGRYEVTLLEAETTFASPNQRVFNVNLEGQEVLSFFDIVAAAGAMNVPVSLVFTADVADAQLELQFVDQVENARASGIQVRRVGEVDADGDGIPNWWTLGYFDHASGQEGDLSLPTDDPDGDGFANLLEYFALTDPLDGESYLRVAGIGVDGVSLMSAVGRDYLLEANNVTDGVWSVVVSNQPGTGGLMTLIDTNTPAMRWYRVGAGLP
jgi:alpha-amylase